MTRNRKFIALVLFALALVFLMGDVNLQTSATSAPIDLGATVQTVAPYGLMTWLIVSGERRYSELVKAQREERHWLLDAALTGKSSRGMSED